MIGAEPVTVLVCTRDRPAALRKAVKEILDSNYKDFDFHVIDQSSDDSSEKVIAEFRGDSRLRYTRTDTRGLSRARNLGVSLAKPGIIAMTDDDCRVARDWLREMVAAFSVSDRIAVVFGNVVPAAHDQSRGFILGYLRTSPFLASGITDKARVEGMGACMGIRSEAWTALSGFDQMLGAGSPFPSSDETDFVIRALLTGYQAYETPAPKVVHEGFRSREDADRLIHGYLKGIGAMLAKHVKCGTLPVFHVYRALALRWMFGHPVVEYGFRPARWVRLSGFLEGSLEAAKTEVDNKTRLFVASES
jgi:GT2 family glycosyltransferase